MKRRAGPAVRFVFGRLSPGSERNLRDTLASETVGGAILLAATIVALVWANSPWRASYAGLRDAVVGPPWLANLHLSLTVGDWATDGLLAIFFFVIGLELKREFVAGELRRPATAIVPMVAAVGGMLAPAAIYIAINLSMAGGDLRGWGVPTATDIAFAVAVLAVVSTHLPSAVRMFLLTLAVVDDLLAIVVIAVFYSQGVSIGLLLVALGVIALFGLLVQKRITPWWLLVPLGIAAWAFMHASGIHATIAGVLLGFTVPAVVTAADRGVAPDGPSLAERFEHRMRPLSSGVAVPLFALFSAGVTFSGSLLVAAAGDPVAIGTAIALVIGKPLGIVTATFLVARFTRARLDDGLSWWDVLGVGTLGGIGFTVSLLVGSLAFGLDSAHDEHIKVAILVASTTAACLGAAILAWRNRVYRREIAQADTLGPAGA